MPEIIFICFQYLASWKIRFVNIFLFSFWLICGIFFSPLAVLAVDDFSVSSRSAILHCAQQGEGIIFPFYRQRNCDLITYPSFHSSQVPDPRFEPGFTWIPGPCFLHHSTTLFENVILNVLPIQKVLVGRSLPALLRLTHRQQLMDGPFVLGARWGLWGHCRLSLIPPSSRHVGHEASEWRSSFPTSENK